ncbi:FMN phosphatase YigB (HAD superfamily) [Arthrobacter roseus]|nr:FMN phosphatase YigB (HAD superfamily) [Arthrobacter roseus]
MSMLSRSDFWYLFDYGMVVSTAPEANDWRALEHATGADLEPKTSTYWANREAFDSGQLNPQEYWSGVLDRPASRAEIESLENLDLALWSHLNPTTLSVLETLQNEQARMALLSNMPVQMSKRHLDGSSWTKYFSKLYWLFAFRGEYQPAEMNFMPPSGQHFSIGYVIGNWSDCGTLEQSV